MSNPTVKVEKVENTVYVSETTYEPGHTFKQYYEVEF